MQDIFHNLEIVDVKGWYVSEFSAGIQILRKPVLL